MARVTAEVLVALDELRQPQGVTLTKIARELDRSRSSVQRALDSLLRDGVITAHVGGDRPLYRLSDAAPTAALLEVASWLLQRQRQRRQRPGT